MEKKKRSALRRFRRTQGFLTTNPVEGTSVQQQVLDEVIREMTASGEEQDASARLTRGETARQRALRNALWNHHMAPLSRIARRAFGIPGMDAKFLLPPKRADNEAIINSARGMAQAAEQHAQVFVQQGLPSDFVAQLRAATDELAAVLKVRVQGQQRSKTSRETLDVLVKRGIAALDVLDAIVKPRLADQPELLATWNSVKRPIDVGGGASAGAGEVDISPVAKVA